MKPVVAIVGRPNVGKSTLFNRITRSRDAIVENYPGITRDRHYGDANWNDVEFTLVDTGGFVSENTEEFTEQIRFQIDRAIADADAVVVLFDGKHGVSPFDKEIAELLRKTKLPVFYVVNKIDGHKSEVNLYEFYSIGINKLYPVSAEHKYGIGDFLDELVSIFPQITQPEPVDMIKLSVTGRPNVGKSSLINRILGQERLIVSDIPGTTRDAVHSVCKVNGQSYMLIDTAGIRRKGRVTKKVEKFSVIKALKSLELCDIALIMIDASEGITAQDTSVAGYAVERGCGCVFLLNKWDAVQKENKDVKIYYEEIKRFAKFLSFAPIITISALTGQRVPKIFDLVSKVYTQYSFRIDTGPLNRILAKALKKSKPSLHKGKQLKFYYATQISSKPPTFVMFVNYPQAVHFSYKRYLVNQIREGAGLDKTPVRLIFRQRTGRIEFGKKK